MATFEDKVKSLLDGKLEPEAETLPKTPLEVYALSAAISLKRIADRLDENTSHYYNEPAFRARGDIA